MSARIAVFFTGGTIAMTEQPDGVVRPALRLAELLAELEGVQSALEPVDWAQLPSPHMTPELMFKLARDVDAMLARPDIDGAVITHGTDVMEETAFMLDAVVRSPKPVVITGAMRSHGEAGYDGLRNLANAVRVCKKSVPAGMGTLLLMTDKLFAAREATKVHSMGVDAFDAPGFGPVGTCVAKDVQIFRLPLPYERLHVQRIEAAVDLVALAPGMDGSFIRCGRERGVKGIVVEGFGAGNVPPSALPEIEAAVRAGIPVVLTSRCVEGGVWPVYGYSGGANQLRDMGVILGGSLRAQKARILLMIALGQKHADAVACARNVFANFPV